MNINRLLAGINRRVLIMRKHIFLPISKFSNKFYFKLTQVQPEIYILTEIPNRFKLKYFVNSSRSIERARFEYNSEPELLDLIYNLCPKTDPSKFVFIDVGANVGTYSLIAGKVGWKVIAIEPNYANSYILSKNIELNNLGESVLQIKAAISDKTRITELIHHKAVEGGNSGATIDYYYRDQNKDVTYRESILAISLDDLLSSLAIKPKLLKIDTDGNELQVLKGAKNLLGSGHLSAVLVEISSELEKDKVCNLLKRFGFRLTLVANKSDSIFVQNLIFIPVN